MRVFLFILFFAIASTFNQARAEDGTASPPEDEEVMDGLPPRITEADAERIKQLHKDMPGLHPDTFKIRPTSFRRKLTPEEEAKMKEFHELKQARNKEKILKMAKDHLAKSAEKLGKMTEEEAKELIEKGKEFMADEEGGEKNEEDANKKHEEL